MESGFVSELCHIPPETLGRHLHLREHSDAHRCRGKSLMGTALVGVGVRQHARRESISKRAPSTTRTSLRSTRPIVRSRQADCVESPDYRKVASAAKANCDVTVT